MEYPENSWHAQEDGSSKLYAMVNNSNEHMT